MITKKEISEKVVCTKGTGFSPQWKYYIEVDGERFCKDFMDEFAYADNRWNNPIGEVRNKREFVDRVHEHVNRKIEFYTNDELRVRYEANDLRYEQMQSISGEISEMAYSMGEDVDSYGLLRDFWYSYEPAEWIKIK